MAEKEQKKKRKRSGDAVTFAAEVTPDVGSSPRPLSKRALSAKTVAENRAAHFARADSTTTTVNKSAGTTKKSAAGTTPTGFSSNGVSSQGEQWCGPFTVARNMIAAREAAKKARDETIANSTAGKVTICTNEDEYDQHVNAAQLRWKPYAGTSNTAVKRSQIAPLTDLCVQLLASHFDDMEEETLRYVSPELLHKFAAEMAKRRKFVPEVATKLAVEGSEELSFPECSFLNDETLVTAFAHISQGHGITHVQKLKSLKLMNVGHSFTDSIATLVSDKYAADLEILEITGCYRMTESALCILLAKCQDKLRVLDLSCNSRIGSNAISAIAALRNLTSLKMDNIVGMGDEQLALFTKPSPSSSSSSSSSSFSSSSASSYSSSSSSGSGSSPCCLLPHLRHLSLNGSLDMTDKGLINLLEAFGQSLLSLSINSCTQLTDDSIVKIRECCRNLEELDISDLVGISTEALLGLFVTDGSTTALADEEQGLDDEMSNGNHRLGDGNGVNDDDDDDVDAVTMVTPASNLSLASADTASLASADAASSAATTTTTPLMDPIGRTMRSIRLRGLVGVTDDVIIELCRTVARGSLRCVDLGGCAELSNRSLAALFLHCKDSLEIMDLSFVRRIDEACLGDLVDGSLFLKSLSVWGCTQLSGKFFDGIRNQVVNVVGKMDAV